MKTGAYFFLLKVNIVFIAVACELDCSIFLKYNIQR